MFLLTQVLSLYIDVIFYLFSDKLIYLAECFFFFIYSVCDGALLPRLGENGKALEICPECKCKHEARNTTLIKVIFFKRNGIYFLI